MTKLNKSQLYDYLENKIFSSPKKEKKIGLEVEMFAFKREEERIKRVFLDESLPILRIFFEKDDWKQHDPKSLIFKKGNAQFSFEPGGQIEFSSSPCNSLLELQKELESAQNKLKSVFKPHKIHLLQTGHDPWSSLESISVQLKQKRYESMASYFKSLPDSSGTSMMLQTSSEQICLDFDFDKKHLRQQYLLAQALSPFATALFANSPFVNGQRSEFETYRGHIWQKTDSSRTGLVFSSSKSFFDQSYEDIIEAYLDFALAAGLFFLKQDGEYIKAPKGFTFMRWLNEPKLKGPDIEDFSELLSTLFPEVRPKGFIEIRSVDAQDYLFQFVPVVFYSGLLYSHDSVEMAIEILKPFSEKLTSLRQISSKGLLASKILSQISSELMILALSSFEKQVNPGAELILNSAREFYERYTKQGLLSFPRLRNLS